MILAGGSSRTNPLLGYPTMVNPREFGKREDGSGRDELFGREEKRKRRRGRGESGLQLLQTVSKKLIPV